MIEVTAEALSGLADKIGSLELTEVEQAVLDRVLERAGQTDEVTGFVASEDELIAAKIMPDAEIQGVRHDTAKAIGLSPMGFKLGQGAGLWG